MTGSFAYFRGYVPNVTMETQEEKIVVPRIAEELTVGKRVIETGGVRVVKTVSEREETVEPHAVYETAVVERVPIDRILEANEPVPVAHEAAGGSVWIVPVLEEVTVIEKRVRLVEEIHVRRRREETALAPQTLTLRREEVHVESLFEEQNNTAHEQARGTEG